MVRTYTKSVETTELLYQIYLKMKDTMINGTLPQNYDLEADFFINGVLQSDPGLVELNKLSNHLHL
jgi:hypothetical protein